MPPTEEDRGDEEGYTTLEGLKLPKPDELEQKNCVVDKAQQTTLRYQQVQVLENQAKRFGQFLLRTFQKTLAKCFREREAGLNRGAASIETEETPTGSHHQAEDPKPPGSEDRSHNSPRRETTDQAGCNRSDESGAKPAQQV